MIKFLIVIFILLLMRQIFVERNAFIRDKESWPAMYIGDDWHLNEPFWIKQECDGKIIQNEKFQGRYRGILNEEGQRLKKEMGQ